MFVILQGSNNFAMVVLDPQDSLGFGELGFLCGVDFADVFIGVLPHHLDLILTQGLGLAHRIISTMEILALLVVEEHMMQLLDRGEPMAPQERHKSLLLIAALGRIHH